VERKKINKNTIKSITLKLNKIKVKIEKHFHSPSSTNYWIIVFLGLIIILYYLIIFIEIQILPQDLSIIYNIEIILWIMSPADIIITIA
jgi:CBS domain containing-hemolysin-like protein